MNVHGLENVTSEKKKYIQNFVNETFYKRWGIRLEGNVGTLTLMVISAAVGGTLQYGYNLAIINAPTVYIQNFVNETFYKRWGIRLEVYQLTLIWTLIVSVFSLGGLTGALLAGPMSIHFGSSLLALASRKAEFFEMIIISRFLVGINAGVSMNVQPMYFGESAPKHLRGAISLSSAVFNSFGVVLGQVVGLREVLGCESCWQYLLASNAVPGLIQLITLPWFPESPRYLLIDRGDKEGCLKALRQLRGCELQRGELDEILQEQADSEGKHAQGPWDLISDRTFRWQLISISVLSSAMQLCGNDSIYFYSSYIFQEAGISTEQTQYVTIGTGTCEFTACILCNLLIEWQGRRVLLMGGYVLMTGWAIAFTVALSFQACNTFPPKKLGRGQFRASNEHIVQWMPYLSMTCVFTYILSFGMGPAGVTIILPTELFNQATRPAAYMIAGSLMWFNLFITGMIFPFLVSGLGQFCFVPFGTVCLFTAIYIRLVLPETRGKTLPMITREFHRLNFHKQEKISLKRKQALYQLGEALRSTDV